MLEFLRFWKGDVYFYSGMVLLTPVLLLMKMGLLPRYRAKELLLTLFISGKRFSDFELACDLFVDKRLDKLIRPAALRAIDEYRKKKYRIVIVSASAKFWIRKWTQSKEIELIASDLEIKNNKMTGRLSGLNCNGPEKVNRIKNLIKLEDYDEIIAYGDSRGDAPMLELADRSYFKPFRK